MVRPIVPLNCESGLGRASCARAGTVAIATVSSETLVNAERKRLIAFITVLLQRRALCSAQSCRQQRAFRPSRRRFLHCLLWTVRPSAYGFNSTVTFSMLPVNLNGGL